MNRPEFALSRIPVVAAAFAFALVLAACGDQTTPSKTVEPVKTPPAPVATAQPQPEQAAPAPAPKPDPDAELAAKVKSALGEDGDLKMLPIDVRASNGAVTLYGTADNAGMKRKAAQVASKVDGVKSVVNNLQIVKGS